MEAPGDLRSTAVPSSGNLTPLPVRGLSLFPIYIYDVPYRLDRDSIESGKDILGERGCRNGGNIHP